MALYIGTGGSLRRIEWLNMNGIITVQHNIGGGVVYLDCEDNQKLLEFYQNENNNFKVFGDRYSTNEDIHFKQLLRLF